MQSQAAGTRIPPAEWLVPAVAVLILLAAAAVSSGRSYYWFDEIFSLAQITQAGPAAIIETLHTTAVDTAVPLYLLLAHLWGRLFGYEALSLRLLSALLTSTGALTLWLTLRRRYHGLAAALGLAGGLMACTLVLRANPEVRFYGLLIALTGLSMLLYERQSALDKPAWPLLLLNALVHAAFVLTHVFGFVYGAVTLAALLLCDAAQRRLRPPIYLSVALGWLAFAGEAGRYVRIAQTFAGRSWISPPTWPDLASLYTQVFYGSYIVLLLLALLLISLRWAPIRWRVEDVQAQVGRSPLLIYGLLSSLAPLGVWLISLPPGDSIFSHRYMTSSALGLAAVIAHLGQAVLIRYAPGAQIASAFSRARLTPRLAVPRALIPALILACGPVPLLGVLMLPQGPLPGAFDDVYGGEGLPIVVEDPLRYLPRAYYAPQRARYIFPVDEQVLAASPRMTSAVISLEAFGQRFEGYRVLDSPALLASTDAFLLIEEADDPWFELNLAGQPGWACTELGPLDAGTRLLRIEQGGGPCTP